MASVTTLPPSTFGVSALRSEDPRFLTGRARYVENLPIEGALRAVFVRSIMPHARLNAVQAEAARSMPGVAGVFTASDLDLARMPPSGNRGRCHRHPRWAVRLERCWPATWCGSWVSRSRSWWPTPLPHAEDAAEAVAADYEPLPAVTDVEAALADGAPLLWPEHGSNVASSFSTSWDDDVLAGAEVVARGRFVNQRLAPVPMEGNAIAVATAQRRHVHGMGVDAGAVRRARRPRRGARRRQACRAHDRSRRRWRVRCQAAGLPRVPGGRGGGRAPRPAGALDRVAFGRHAGPHARPRAGAARRDRRAPRRHDRRPARRSRRRHGGVPDRGVPAEHDPGDALGRLRDPAHRLERPKRRHERDAGRALSRGGTARGHCPDRACGRPGGRRARHGPGRGSSKEPDPARGVPVPDGIGHGVRRRRLRALVGRGAAARRVRRPSRRASRPQAAGRPPRAGYRRRRPTSRSRRSARRSSRRSRSTPTAA